VFRVGRREEELQNSPENAHGRGLRETTP
jgi:hypothetical protein